MTIKPAISILEKLKEQQIIYVDLKLQIIHIKNIKINVPIKEESVRIKQP